MTTVTVNIDNKKNLNVKPYGSHLNEYDLK